MLNVFTPLPAEARAEHQLAYREFLRERDGEVDRVNRKLSHRERAMERYTSVRPKRQLDRVLFDAQYTQFDPKRKTSPEMLLLLALVKTNAAEAYGVETVLPKVIARLEKRGAAADDIETVLMIEEDYHTRILLSSACHYGMDITLPYRPPLGLRTLVALVGSIPHTMARPLTLAGEIIGCVTFLTLLGQVKHIFKDDPEVRDAIEERVTEVLIDEVGHVTFNRLCMSSWGLFQARAILPMVSLGTADITPEYAHLGVNVDGDIEKLKQIPESILKRSFVV